MPPLSVEHRSQGPADDFAQGESCARGMATQLADLRDGQLHGEGDLGRADRNGMAEALRLPHIAIGLARGDGACLGEPLHCLRKRRTTLQQDAGAIEALRPLSCVGTGHMTYRYNLKRQPSRSGRVGTVTPGIPVGPLKLDLSVKGEIIDCVRGVGSSKWNPIEHRLFSQISNNWAGRPLESYETVLNYIRTTSTSTGLEVEARMLPRKYEKGEAISTGQMRQLMLANHTTLPAWNYTLTPSTM